ncbi:hypothetical protein AB9F35_35490, partial [Rhizobium leguminosarum]
LPAEQAVGSPWTSTHQAAAPRLEGELGVQLLVRTTRGASLNEAGTTFRDYAARVSAEIDVDRETLLPDGELRGRLRIAAPLS